MSGFDITGQSRWGIIGDGQLARMLALAAYPLGIRPVVLTGDQSSPAGQVCPLIVRGHPASRDDLHGLLSQVDGAIIESEFVNCEALEATGLADKVFPPIAAIRILQNKLLQKKMLTDLAIPTAPFRELPGTEFYPHLDALSATGCVLKFSTFGYDGKGVYILKGGDSKSLEGAEDFMTLARKRQIMVYAEDFVPFEREVAMIAVRSVKGDIKTWPLVITEQRAGICERVTGPAKSLGIDTSTETRAAIICEKIATHLGIIGVFAVEFFMTREGQLLVNEIAPRVHNSGHYTLDASSTSQFENHWRAVCGMPLGPTTTAPIFMMQNILGPAEITTKDNVSPPQGSSATHIHWYGKRGMSPGRKLGHVNAYAHDISARGDLISSVAAVAAQWNDRQKSIFTPAIENSENSPHEDAQEDPKKS